MKSMVIELVTPLSGSASYTSGTRDMKTVEQDYGIAVSNFVVEVDSDAGGTLEIDESSDMIVWEQSQSPTGYTGGEGVLRLSILPEQRYVRAKFTNGSGAQTRFTMSTGVDYT
jgi:hypothetical protein